MPGFGRIEFTLEQVEHCATASSTLSSSMVKRAVSRISCGISKVLVVAILCFLSRSSQATAAHASRQLPTESDCLKYTAPHNLEELPMRSDRKNPQPVQFCSYVVSCESR